MTITVYIKSLFRRRPRFTQNELMETPLKRCLNLYDLVFYSVANMAGAGIYVLSGRLIRNEAGAAACLSYIVAAVSSIFTGMCYAELSTLIPKAGSVYVYTFLTLGELPAFIIGWTAISDIIVGIASISKAFSGTIDELSGRVISNWTVETFGTLGEEDRGILSPTFDLVAMALIILMILITATGAKASLTFNIAITCGQIFCLVLMSTGGFFYGSTRSWTDHGGFAPSGAAGVLSGATIAVFAFSGFDSIANASEETKDPKETIPKALFWSIMVMTTLYCLASIGLALLVPREYIDYTSPFVHGYNRLGVTWLMWVSGIGTLLATGAGKITSMYIVPRMIYSIASDGLIFRPLEDVSRGTKVPLNALICGGLFAGFLALFLNIQTLAEFMSLGILFSYFTIGINILVLRYLMIDDETKNAFELIKDDTDPSERAICSTQTETVTTVNTRTPYLANIYSVLTKREFFCSLIVSLTLTSLTTMAVAELGYKYNSYSLMVLAGFLFMVWFISVLLLSTYQPSMSNDSYQTPFMPMAPVMTIFINSLLIARLPMLTWARFGIWMIVGLAIYFFYGRSHSIAKPENQLLRADKEKENLSAKQDKDTYGATDKKN